MATVYNPAPFSLFCEALHEEIPAESSVECDDATAEIVGGTVFVVTLGSSETPAKDSVEVAEVPTDDVETAIKTSEFDDA